MTDDTPNTRFEKTIIDPDRSVTDALRQMETGQAGILLLCKDDRKLIGVLTDGDIRRAWLNGVPFDGPCRAVASKDPIVAREDVTPAEALRLMDLEKKGHLNHLPIVDKNNRVVDLLLRRDLLPGSPGFSAVVMAGGLGKRLRPLTDDTPKPMLPVGDRPMMERIIEQLREAGIHRVNVSTNYKAEKIRSHFGDGRDFGLEIEYVNEDRPLGTAGALSLMKANDEPLLVINGDVLTGVDYSRMLDFHVDHQADMTVGVREHETQIPFGVLEIDGVDIKSLSEKPVLRNFISAGIYLLSPLACSRIPSNQAYDMPELINDLIKSGHRVVSYPIVEYWKDVGQLADYLQAQEDVTIQELSS